MLTAGFMRPHFNYYFINQRRKKSKRFMKKDSQNGIFFDKYYNYKTFFTCFADMFVLKSGWVSATKIA